MAECIICMDKINDKRYIMFLNDIEAACSCMKNNKIHKKCFKEWIASKNNELLCPICLSNISTTNVLLYEKETLKHIHDYLNNNNEDTNIIIESYNNIEPAEDSDNIIEVNNSSEQLIQSNQNNVPFAKCCSYICPLLGIAGFSCMFYIIFYN